MVGIHTTAPRSTFDVNGDITVNGFRMPDGAAPGFVLTAADGDGNAKWAELPAGGGGSADCLWSALNGNIYYNESGNVGIGKTNPSYKLDVEGTVSARGLHIQDGWVSGYVLTASGITGEAVWAELPAGSGGSYNLTGQVVSDNNGVASLTVQAIDAQTNVAIISGTDKILYSNGVDLKQTEISVLESYMQTNLDFGDGGSGGIIGEGFWKPNPANKLEIFYNDGSVGIGTDSPDEALHVTGTIKTEGDLIMEGPANKIFFGNSQTSTFQIARISDPLSGIINISADDNVGIGASANDAKLRVGGNVLVEEDIVSNANISADGNISSSGFMEIDNINSQMIFGAGNPSTFSLIKRNGQQQQDEINILTVGENNFVGILTDGEPGAELDVNGDVLVSGDIESNSNVIVEGGITAGGDIETESNLQVEGNIIANGRIATANFQMANQTAGADKILQSDADGNASWVTAEESGVRLWEENASGNIFRDGSFVGIGTSQPQALLHIEFGTGHAGIQFTTDEETYTNDYPIQFITGVNGSHGTLTQYIPNKGGDYIWTCQPDQGEEKIEGMRLAVSPWGNNQGVLSINGRLNTNSLKIISTENVNGYILQADADGDATWVEQWKKESTGVLSYQLPIAIGTTEVGTHHLVVAGSINAEEILVTETVPGSDYVFEEDYKLMPLAELETYVNTNKHLPEVKSAKEFKEEGYSIGKMDDVLLRKVEELTLYMIAQQKIIDELVEKVRSLEEN